MRPPLPTLPTGLKKRGLLDVLAPEQQKGLLGSRDYLRMADKANTAAGGPNSQTTQNAFTAIAEGVAKQNLPKVISFLTPFADMLDQAGKTRFDRLMNEALLDPSKLADAMKMLPKPKQAQALAFLDKVKLASGPAGEAASREAR